MKFRLNLKLRQTTVFFAFLLIAPFALNAATYFVAVNGNDGNPGTDSQPFLTIQRGVDAAAPGDTIIVQDGTYTPSASSGCSGGEGYQVTIDKPGLPNAPITLRAANKWGATLDAQMTCSAVFNFHGQAAYWVIQDFKVTNAYSAAITSNSGASYITVKGNHIYNIGRRIDATRYGIVGIYTNQASHDWVIDGNQLDTIGRIGGLPSQPSNDHALYLHSMNTTVVNNNFYQPIQGWCIQTAEGFSGTIASNSFYGPQSNAIYGRGGGGTGHIVLWDSNPSLVIRGNNFYGPNNAGIAIAGLTGTSASSCFIDGNAIYGQGLALTDQDISAICSIGPNVLNAANPVQ